MEPKLARCRDCGKEVSWDAYQCPHCGAPKPYLATWEGHGFGWQSKTTLFGWPLVHISFRYKPRPVPAKGIIAIGQFGVGLLTIAQFGVGLVTVTQFGVGIWILAQMALGWTGIAQIGVLPGGGMGQMIWP